MVYLSLFVKQAKKSFFETLVSKVASFCSATLSWPIESPQRSNFHSSAMVGKQAGCEIGGGGVWIFSSLWWCLDFLKLVVVPGFSQDDGGDWISQVSGCAWNFSSWWWWLDFLKLVVVRNYFLFGGGAWIFSSLCWCLNVLIMVVNMHEFSQFDGSACIFLNWLWCLNFVKSLMVPGFSHVGGVCLDFNNLVVGHVCSLVGGDS